MQFLEKQLEDIIFEHLQTKDGRQKLKDRGLYVFSDRFFWVKRQVNLGAYGIADIVTATLCDGELFITIYELKQKSVCEKALIQAARYRKAVSRYVQNRWKRDLHISINLIGSNVHDSEWVYLIDALEDLTVYADQYDIDGLKFNDCYGFHLIDEKF